MEPGEPAQYLFPWLPLVGGGILALTHLWSGVLEARDCNCPPHITSVSVTSMSVSSLVS